MYLERLTVQNFKAFPEAEISLPPTGVVLLVGPNNSGKSALLSAFNVLLGAGLGVVRYAGSAGPVTVTARFKLSSADRDTVFAQSAATADPWNSSQALSWLEMRYREIAPGAFVADQLRTTRGDGGAEVVAELRWKSAQEGDLVAVQSKDWFRDNHPDAPFRLNTVHNNTATNALHTLGDTAFVGLLPALEQWRRNFYHFGPLRPGTGRSRTAQAAAELNPTGENLPEALLQHSSRESPQWDEIRGAIARMVPEIGQLRAPVIANTVEVVFRDSFLGVERNLKELGTGVEQLLLTSYVAIAHPPGLVLVEEPETSLHPEAQRRLLEHLVEWSNDRVFLISTHSTVFLERAARTGIPVWLVQRHAGVSSVTQSDSHLAAVLDELGVRLGDVLSSDRILILEGDSDANILRTWFPQLMGEAGLAVATRSGGGDAAWQADFVQRTLEAGDLLKRRVLFLRDRDELRAESIEELQATDVVHVLARREIENYLLDPEALTPALVARLRDSNAVTDEPTVEQVNITLREVAESLRPHVVLKRVVQSLVPVRLVDHNSVERLSEEEPSLAGLIDLIKARLPDPEAIVQEVSTKWAEEETTVAQGWDDHWEEWAPGADVLAALWRAFGLAFDKTRDGPRIAALRAGPDELKLVLEGFLADGRGQPTEALDLSATH